MKEHETMKRNGYTLIAAGIFITLLGCPPVDPPNDDQSLYDRGFEDGFLEDDWYWDGYYDGYDTVDITPVYYDDSEILYLEEPPYDAGYWDGIWYAYNDGYFVDYRYAFILGFSEGYDNAFWSGYLDFLADDVHTEYSHGGWIDGYNDGFSEGRVFGANDYEQGLPFDWLDALYDYESGTDLYFEEVDLGTGAYGPVVLYEYGVDPTEGAKDLRPRARVPRREIRGTSKQIDLEDRTVFRPLPPQTQQELDVTPEESLRSGRELQLATTWLQRIQAYTSAKIAKLNTEDGKSQTQRARKR
jgi:hypothetical protein